MTTGPGPPPPRAEQAAQVGRAGWADVAKGACIVLVVLWHVVMKHYLRLPWPPGSPVPGAWGTLGEALLPLRMPVFFTVSGVLAATAVARPWRTLLSGRVATLLWLYVLWVLLHTAWFALVPGLPTARATTPGELLAQLTISPTNLWYLLALAGYLVLGTAVHALPRPAAAGVVALALAAAVLASVEGPAGPAAVLAGNRVDLVQNLPFFLGGLLLAGRLRATLPAVSGRQVLGLGAAAAALLAGVALTGLRGAPGVWPVAALAATAATLAAAALLARVAPDTVWTSGLRRLGARTLPVYVLHLPLLALVDQFVGDHLLVDGSAATALVAVLEPGLVTALLILGCLGLHRALHAGGAGWLFRLPARRAAATVPAVG